MIKATSLELNISIKWITDFTNQENFLLVISLADFEKNNYTININQQIYFLVDGSHEIFEQYTINYHTVIKKLGRFHENIFQRYEGIESSFILRRANFHNSELIAMTEKSPPILGTRIKFQNLPSAPYFPANMTYDATNITRGSFYEILGHLE